MLDKTDPCSIEQSLMGFLSSLGILSKDLYNDKIEELLYKGKIRYSDYRRIGMVHQSTDGKYQFIVFKAPNGRHRPDLSAYLIELYPKSRILNKKNYTGFSDIYKELKTPEAKKLNLRQHKTTINLYAEELPLKIRRNLGCTNSRDPFKT